MLEICCKHLFLHIYEKSAIFCKVAFLQCKSSRKMRPIIRIIFTKKILYKFLQVSSLKKLLNSKRCPFFVSGTLKVPPTPSGGFKKNSTVRFSILASWFHWFWSRILKISCFFSGKAFQSYLHVQQRGDSRALVVMALLGVPTLPLQGE